MFELFGKWLMKSPARNGYLATLASLPYSFYKVEIAAGKNANYAEQLAQGWPSIAAFTIAYLGTLGLQLAGRKTPAKETLAKIKNLEELVERQNPPAIEIKTEQKISYSPANLINFLTQSSETLAKKARKTKNPLVALDAAVGYFGAEDDFQEAMLLLRDAQDWIGGKRPARDLSAKLQSLNTRWALSATRAIEPEAVETYIFSAAYESVSRPENAWKWSELARKIAHEVKPEQKKEAYAYHALLATAQNRADQAQAWQELIATLDEPLWERMGETRSIVKRYTGSRFFTETLVFKEKTSLEALQKEFEASKTLEKIADEISAPQSLYVSETPNSEGRYTYIMRYVSGETLYSQLKRGDKSSMHRIINALAKIHAKFPVQNLPLQDLEAKLQGKLKDKHFSIPAELAQQITDNYSPVLNAFKEIFWAWNKDAHPENWIIGEKISAIDCEAENQAPVSFDLANLLEYGDFFTPIEKRAYITQYAMELGKHGKQYNIVTSTRTYYNSVIYRMLCLTSAWSAPERQNLHDKRKDTIDRAISAIDIIKSEEESYYRRFEQQYKQLRNAFEKLKTIL